MKENKIPKWLDQIGWDAEGLVPVIAQDSTSGKVLMLAWMNREALLKTVEKKLAVYWSRSRQSLWQKGEQSGHIQHVHEILLDCDNDTLVLMVEQTGGIACHTGRYSCFYKKLENETWVDVEPVLKTPNEIYGK